VSRGALFLLPQRDDHKEAVTLSKPETYEQTAIRVSRNSILWNIVLTAFKLFAGIAGNSSAMISDAAHSASDMATTVVVIVGVKLGNRKSDKDHPYGHERFESVAAMIMGISLFILGGGIGWAGVQRILYGLEGGHIGIPGVLALSGAIATIIIKELMYWYTRHWGKAINSGVLMADAWHHRSDALSSIGSFAGILMARLGFPIFDPIASIIICLFILKVAFDIFRDAVGRMTDKACDDATVDAIRSIVLAQEGVLGIHRLRTRVFGDKFYVDIDIGGDGNATLHETHETAQRVHDAIEACFPNVKHCMVHVNPEGKP
jgi:cation diffusion facilitator family transporter